MMAIDDIRLAWEIHKNSDATLHGIINAFLAVQSFLFAGFAALAVLDDNMRTGWLIVIVSAIGVASSFIF